MEVYLWLSIYMVILVPLLLLLIIFSLMRKIGRTKLDNFPSNSSLPARILQQPLSPHHLPSYSLSLSCPLHPHFLLPCLRGHHYHFIILVENEQSSPSFFSYFFFGQGEHHPLILLFNRTTISSPSSFDQHH